MPTATPKRGLFILASRAKASLSFGLQKVLSKLFTGNGNRKEGDDLINHFFHQGIGATGAAGDQYLHFTCLGRVIFSNQFLFFVQVKMPDGFGRNYFLLSL